MMLTDFKERFAPNVKVYRNLHKKCYSVVDRKTGKVMRHSQTVVLDSVWFRVSQAGRARVLREKRKNVHAFVCGILREAAFNWPDTEPREAYYNPYKVDSFVDKETGEKIERADRVMLTDKAIYYWGENGTK